MDAYGTIEPVDIAAMTEVMNQISISDAVQVQGSHWASMINTIGCVKRDLNEALATFESIESAEAQLSRKKREQRLPDALCYEAIFNVIVTHRRIDLLDDYLKRFNATGMHMTAYIANQLIKGYAMGGQIEQARDFFESLSDPPEGMAATNNHGPHPDSPAIPSPRSEPVYREVTIIASSINFC